MKIRLKVMISILMILVMANFALAENNTNLVNFKGKIIDGETQTPIPHANVIILGENLGTVTDESGNFDIEFPAEDEFIFQVKVVGYKSYTEKIQITAPMISRNIQLEVSPIPLETVVVTARGREAMLKNIPGSVGVLHENDIQEGNPIGISDVAMKIPGISKSSDMPWGSDVAVRGLSEDKVVFLVDGNRVSTSTEIPAQYGTVASQDIQRVEVLKGPISVLYGTGSIGGVVNVITRSGKFSDYSNWNFGTTSSYESVSDGLSTYGRIGYNGPNFYFLLTQSFRDYNNYDAGDDLEIPNSQFKDYQTSINLGYRLNYHHKFEVKYQYMEAKDVGIPGGGSQFPANANVSYPATRRNLFELGWTFQPNNRIWRESKMEFFLQPIQRRPQVIPNTVTETPTKIIRPQKITPKADHDVIGARWKSVFELGRNELVAGVEGWQKEYNGSRKKEIEIDILDETGNVIKTVENTIVDKPLPDATYRPLGIFAENEMDISEKLLVSMGGRVDFIHTENEQTYVTYEPETEEILWEATEDNDVSWSLQSGLLYRFTPSFSTNWVIARSFRSPALSERYQYIDLGSLVKIGDPNLNSEESSFVEGGIRFQQETFVWTAQAFLNSTKNLVIDAPGTYEGRDALIKTNAGEAKLYGFESEAKWAIIPKLLLTADISYTRGKDEKEDEDLPAIPPLNGHFRVNYGGGIGIWLEAAMNAFAEQDHVAPGESPTDGYVTADLKFGYKRFMTGKISHNFTLGIRNLTDSQYKNHLTSSRGFELYEPGRSVFLTWSMEM